MPAIKDPEIKFGLTRDGVERIEIFADTRQDRDRCIRAVLNASEEFERLQKAVREVL